MSYYSKKNRSSSIGYSRSYSSSSYGSTYGYSTSYRRDRDDYYSGWNWGSFNSFAYDEDDDKDLYIKNHESYFTPRSQEIERKLDWAQNTKKNKDLIKEMARYFYYKMVDDKDYFDSKFDKVDKLTEEEITTFQSKKEFYEGLWDKFVPGITPLEKSLNIFSKLNEVAGKKKEYTTGDLEKCESMVDFHEEVYNDPEYNELLDTNLFSKEYKFDILNRISMIRNLGSEFKVQKEVEDKLAANSSIVAKKIMRDYSQMHNIELYQRLMPNFNIKLLTKDLVVNVPIDRTEHKQKIIILLDFSGSMSTRDKQKWVVAILIDRLRYAMKEEAEVFFSYFVDSPSYMHFTHIYDKKTALEFWQKFSTSPNGGDTKLGEMVNYIKKEITENHKLCNLPIDLSEEQPEILAINDGQTWPVIVAILLCNPFNCWDILIY